MPVPSSPFLRDLHRAVVAELQPQIRLTLQVGVLTAAGMRRAEILEKTGAAPNDLRAAQILLRRATIHMEDPTS